MYIYYCFILCINVLYCGPLTVYLEVILVIWLWRDERVKNICNSSHCGSVLLLVAQSKLKMCVFVKAEYLIHLCLMFIWLNNHKFVAG